MIEFAEEAVPSSGLRVDRRFQAAWGADGGCTSGSVDGCVRAATGSPAASSPTASNHERDGHFRPGAMWRA
jgi:hypothetical protein